MNKVTPPSTAGCGAHNEISVWSRIFASVHTQHTQFIVYAVHTAVLNCVYNSDISDDISFAISVRISYSGGFLLTPQLMYCVQLVWQNTG